LFHSFGLRIVRLGGRILLLSWRILLLSWRILLLSRRILLLSWRILRLSRLYYVLLEGSHHIRLSVHVYLVLLKIMRLEEV